MLVFIFSLLVGLVHADTRCYPLTRAEPEGERVESWCYERLPDGGLRIYNADAEVRPELAISIDPHGTITHGSLLAGEITYHRVHRDEFNPFAIPLSEPVMLEPSSTPGAAVLNEARLVFERMEQASALTVRPLSLRAEDGTLRARADWKPWRGSSWSFKSKQLYEGWDSPLAKFDRFIASREGANPGAQAWESEHHAAGYWWGGHCNGWAVSAILRKEPKVARWDPASGISFKISAQKGLLAAKDFCAKIAMFGKRNNGKEPPKTDIEPHVFHKTLLYYVGELRKPLAVDYRPDDVVDTHVITGYTIRIFAVDSGIWRVATRVNIHRYEQRPSERTGEASEYHRDYHYDLHVDGDQKITGGAWISDNPDFVYSPLSSAYCPERHPAITEQRLEKVFSLQEVF